MIFNKLSVCALLGLLAASNAAEKKQAIAVFHSADAVTDRKVTGTAVFTQDLVGADKSNDNSDVTLQLDVKGLVPGSTHAIHVHQFGDPSNTKDFSTLGTHFIPACVTPPKEGEEPIVYKFPDPEADQCTKDAYHGFASGAHPDWRNPGDIGNFTVDDNGDFSGTFVLGQEKVSLKDSARSIIGRSVVIHERADNGQQERNGDAGGPYAYGIIGLQSTPAADTNIAASEKAPAPTLAICEFQKFSEADTVTGMIRLTYQIGRNGEPPKIRMKGSISGLQAKTHSFHFHEFGDMSGEADILGPVHKSDDIKIELLEVEDASSPKEVDTIFDSTVDGLYSVLGRSLTIHDGPLLTDKTFARAVCGTSMVGDNWGGVNDNDNASSKTGISLTAGLVALAMMLRN